MKKVNLLLVDFEAGIAGMEDAVSSGIHCWIHKTTEYAELGEFREVTETLAVCCTGEKYHVGHDYACGGWNPVGFHGGTCTSAVVGPLAVVQAIFRNTFFRVGDELELNGVKYLVRPCRADLMPLRLWQRHESRWWGRREKQLEAKGEKPFGFWEARRLCFEHRNDPKPKRVYFAKGTTSVEPPAEAVARIGGSESSTVVFLDKYARPIAAYKDAGGWNSYYAASIPIPDRLDWRRLRSLGKSTRDIMFGVHG